MEFSVKKTIDSLGRIVIPKSIREYYEIGLGDELTIVPTEDGILIVKKSEERGSKRKKEPCRQEKL